MKSTDLRAGADSPAARVAGWLADRVLDAEPLIVGGAALVLLLPLTYLWRWQRGLGAFAPIADAALENPEGPVWAALGAVAVLWLIRWVRHGYLTRRSPFDLPVVLYGLGLAVGAWVSPDPAHSRELFLGGIAGILIYYAGVNWIGPSPTRWRLAAAAVLLGGIGLAVVGFLLTDWAHMPLNPLTARWEWLHRMSVRLPEVASKRANVSVVAQTLSLVIPFGLLLGWAREPVWLRVLGVVAAATMMGYVLLGWSRGDLIALGVAALVVPAMVITAWRYVLGGGLAIATAGALVWQWLNPSIFSLWGALIQVYPGRWQVWLRALHILRDLPFTGTGLGMFRLVAQVEYPYFDPALDQAEHAHNLYLQSGVDGGVLGLAAILLLMVLFYRQVWPLLNTRPRLAECLALAGGFTAFLVSGLFDDAVMTSPRMAVLFWLLLCLAATRFQWHKKEHAASTTHVPAPKATWAAGVVIALVLTVIVGRPVLAGAWLGNLANLEREQGIFAPGLEDGERALRAERAVSQYESALAANPEDGAVHRQLGSLFSKGDDARDAAARVARTPGIEFQPIAFFEKAARLQDSAGPIGHLEQATRLRPWDIFGHYYLAESYRVHGRLEDAAVEFLRADLPLNHMIDMGIAAYNWGRGDYGLAVQYLRIATWMAPDSAEAFAALGQVHTIQKAYPDAVAAWLAATRLKPGDATFHAALGDVYRDSGMAAAASAEYKRTLELDPGHAHAREELSRLPARP